MSKSVSLRRYSQIAEVLVKYGFGYYINALLPGFNLKRVSARPADDIDSYSTYARIRMALEELGPTFVKFGQLMSTRTELFPAELIEELCKLQDRVGVVPFEEVIPTLDKYIPDWRDILTSVDPKPLAAASISQVYRAVMDDGTVMAFKIQRPNIKKRIEQDIILLRNIAQIIENKMPELRMYNPISLVDDFAIQIRKELDFTRDGMNAERIARNMKASGIQRIKVPKIYWQFSGQELLAMEYVAGCRGDDIDAITARGIDPKELASIGLHAFMVQIFQNGFYHGDPHAGNIRVSPNGELIFLDFGVCGVLMKDMRNKFISLLLALLSADTDMTIRCVKNLGVVIPSTGMDDFRGELYLALSDFKEMGTNANFSGLLSSIQNLFQQNNIRIPPNIMQLLKALMLVANVAFTLDPKLAFAEEVEPFLKQIIADELKSPDNMQKRLLEAKVKMEDLASVPKKINSVLEMASEGKLKIDIEAKAVTQLSETIKGAIDKIVICVLMSAIVIGLSLVMMNQSFTMSAIPIIAYIVAVIVLVAFAIGFRARVKKNRRK